MDKIKLLCVENVITRQATVVHQRLSVAVLVANTAHHKSVDVKWAGEDGVWHTLRARYHSSVDREKEYWVARKTFTLISSKPLPGNVRFALRYRVAGKEYWDNNHGHNYSIQADSGIRVAQDIPVLNVRFESEVTDGQTVFPVVVAVQRHLEPERVQLTWTIDNWRTSQQHAVPVYAQLLGHRPSEQRQESESLRSPDLARRAERRPLPSHPVPDYLRHQERGLLG